MTTPHPQPWLPGRARRPARALCLLLAALLAAPFAAVPGAAHAPADLSVDAGALPPVDRSSLEGLPDLPEGVHGDWFPTEGLPRLPGTLSPTLAEWVAIPIVRTTLAGEKVPAFHVVNALMTGATAEALAEEGLVAVPLLATPALSKEDVLAMAVAAETARAAVASLQESSSVGVSSAPPSVPITDASPVLVSVYYDQALVDSGYQEESASAYSEAVWLFWNEAGIDLGQYYLNVAPANIPLDVNSACTMQMVAFFEEGFAPADRGSMVHVFSPGGVDGRYGVTVDGPLTLQKRWGESNEHCPSTMAPARTPVYLPQTYVEMDGDTNFQFLTVTSGDLEAVDYLTAHELGHVFTMQHSHAECWSDTFTPWHIHRTVEAVTADTDTPSSCPAHLDPRNHYHWDFSPAGETAMENERKRWTVCYNAGWCPSGATPDAPVATARACDKQVTITVASPPATGGSAIVGYPVYRGTTPYFQDVTPVGWISGTSGSWTDTGLTNGVEYTYYVRAQNSVGRGPRGDFLHATPHAPTAPGAPVLYSATGGVGYVDLSWSPPADDGCSPVTGYNVYRGTCSGCETLLATGVTSTTWRNNGLPAGTTYHYKVAAVNAVGVGAQSNEKSARTATWPGAPVLNAATGGVGYVDLAWSAPVDSGGAGVTSYKLYRGTCSGCETLHVSGITGTTFRDGSLPAGTTYYYKVAAVNAIGTGALSNEKSARTAGVPGAPTLGSATGGVGYVDLAWTAPSDDGGSAVTSYRVYRGTCSGCETLVASGVTGMTYRSSGLAAGTTYYFKVAAVNVVGTGAQSNGRSATTASPPAGPTLTATGEPGHVELSWTPGSDGGSPITSYDVYRGTCSGCETLYESGLTGTVYTDAIVLGGTTYHYKVVARNAVGAGAPSNVAAATPSKWGPDNNHIQYAFVGSGTSWTPGSLDTRNASTQGGEQRPCDLFTGTVWYRFTPTASGTYRFSTAGSDYDTVLAVYGSGTLGASPLACNDNYADWTSQLDLGLTAGTSYWVQVGTKNALGTLQFSAVKL